ncbi:protein Jumonji-like isoform X5 [Pomacea canaliculata]|uniref:protein Jumonji-like isoform X5 n=1 Tax=Pomacea canaliculata TaxID=400727 RepID=UPI000D729EE7|nr:protein Jumonji-like isoform X5 [Pomacea canaliculata]
MVGKRSTQSVTQRSTRQSELHMASRPRRLVPPKTLDDTVGLSRKEERELKKALYASLQETRRTRTPQSETEEGSFSQEPPPKLRTSARRSNISASSSVNSFNTTTSSTAAIDESSQDSVMSSAGSTSESKKKIHAQRKFAQGCSLPTTPSSTPNKKASQSPLNLLNRVPKTEDFLTFLCLRGSHVLPPHLDFFSFTRDDTTVEETNSDPCTPISAEKAGKTEEGRESTPESSSTSSNMNDELMEIASYPMKSPAGTFKPVKTEQSKEKEARATSVRKTLEGASIKLKKNQKLLSEQKEKKNNLLKLSSRKENIIKQIMSKKRLEKKSEKKDERKERDLLPQKISKSKRRTSLRLKTLAKVLGKKRPNYSLVLSGYADMEEYEEEQKKKAAKFALARAKAEARARASAKARKVKELDKMVTRSSSLTTLKVTGDTKRQALSKKQGSTLARKGQDTLANIIESKRVKKETGKETDVQDDVGVKPTSEKEGGKKSASTSSPHNKKVPIKKVAPEKVAASVVPPDPTLAGLEEMSTFRPSEEEFSDPISYISSIKEQAEPFGMCKIIPPASWKMESKVNEEIRFTTQIQHLHRLCNRWGSSVEHTTAINHHLRGVVNDHNAIPQIGGVEVDLPQLYRMIRDFGGLQNIVDKKQWVKVADAMKIPKTAHDRVTRLYDIYCKHVLPYAMLTDAEKVQVQKEVSSSYEMGSVEEEAILKGKSMTLSAFSRVARNVQSMWFKDDPSAEVVEGAYWKIVKERDTHVAVQCAHVNTRAQSTAFPTRRESPYFRHSWNLNNLPENKKCILKCLGPVSGATIPTLHVGMLFSTSCWSTDPHRLPYVQYLHTGANTIWYCIPKTQVQAFHEAMKELCPTLLHNDPCWLKEDTAMVKPDELMSRGVRVARCVQQQRQFVVVFPDVFTATVCCGYSVSESVHYATLEWLSLCVEAAKALSASKEKELFSVDTLVCGLCQDSSDQETLASSLPLLESIVSREIDERHQLSAAGLKCERRLAVEDSPGNSSSLARKRSHDLTEDSICEVCSKICYLSMVLNEHDEQILCLKHGLRYVQRKRHIKAAKLFYRYTEEELTELVQATKDRLAALTSGASGSSLSKKRALKKQDSKS